MKIINQYLGLVFLAILLVASSCTKQDAMIGETLTPTRKSTPIVHSNSLDVAPIIVDNATYGWPTSPFTAVDFTIEDEIIMFSANFPGGCDPVQFTLAAESSVNFTSNGTPIINARLILDNQNKCAAPTKETVAFRLSPIELIGYSSLILDVENYGQIVYDY